MSYNRKLESECLTALNWITLQPAMDSCASDEEARECLSFFFMDIRARI